MLPARFLHRSDERCCSPSIVAEPQRLGVGVGDRRHDRIWGLVCDRRPSANSQPRRTTPGRRSGGFDQPVRGEPRGGRRQRGRCRAPRDTFPSETPGRGRCQTSDAGHCHDPTNPADGKDSLAIAVLVVWARFLTSAASPGRRHRRGEARLLDGGRSWRNQCAHDTAEQIAAQSRAEVEDRLEVARQQAAADRGRGGAAADRSGRRRRLDLG